MFTMLLKRLLALQLILIFVFATASFAQFDSNFILPIPEIEEKLRHGEFKIHKFGDARFDGDITKRVILQFGDAEFVQVKWRRAVNGADVFNNRPRYEMAAYALQKMFLDEDEYVVPPTDARGWTLNAYRKWDPMADATFSNPKIVFFVLQCWLENVSLDDVFDKKRFKRDSLYARHFANMNLFAYLIRHADSNKGNVLISTLPDQPRLFIVDSGVAFDSEPSNRGVKWQKLLIDRVPAKTVRRLQLMTRDMLDKTLGVVAEYKIVSGALTPVPFSENFNPRVGVRRRKGAIQMGLNRREIRNVYVRLQALLKRVKKGQLKLF